MKTALPTDLTVSKKVFIKTFGCQMNEYDSDKMVDVLHAADGYEATQNIDEADLILFNTCSVREKAQEKVFSDLGRIKHLKAKGVKIGVGGCVASQEGAAIIARAPFVDVVFGPQTLHRLPELLRNREQQFKPQVDISFPEIEKFDHLPPAKNNGASAFVSIMRGCNNMCSFCVVPFTRGRERSRDPFTIVSEATHLFDKGFREVTLLGQNVDSYKWQHPETHETFTFAQLLEQVARVHPDLRVRFSTSHPKDMTDDVLHAMASFENICNYIHLPVQSGSSRVLALMNRTYDREWYINRIEAIRKIVPDCAVSSDIIAGFCTETDEDHRETLSMMAWADYCMSYMFSYSERPGTLAARKYKDDIDEDTKKTRLSEIIALQRQLSAEHNARDVGKTFKVLIEGDSRKSDLEFKGRNSQNKMIVFPKVAGLQPGNYADVYVESANSATLIGHIVQS